jgi:hypothetical protein
MVLDTKTCDSTGNVYDVGYAICTKEGEILCTFNVLVQDGVQRPRRYMEYSTDSNQLGSIKDRDHIIECSGVLHHM